MPLSFELVSPERLLFTGPVSEVVVPGMEGDFAVMQHHACFMASLRPGLLSYVAEGTTHRLYVRGGFADVSEHGLIVIAEQAVPLGEFGAGGLAAEMEIFEKDLAAASSDESRRLASERLAQLGELKAQIGS
jgi:F-type H+-transporting ATPase subunit epsilon